MLLEVAVEINQDLHMESNEQTEQQWQPAQNSSDNHRAPSVCNSERLWWFIPLVTILEHYNILGVLLMYRVMQNMRRNSWGSWGNTINQCLRACQRQACRAALWLFSLKQVTAQLEHRSVLEQMYFRDIKLESVATVICEGRQNFLHLLTNSMKKERNC